MRLVVSLYCCFLLVNGNVENAYDEEAGRAYLKKINADIQVKTTESVLVSWAYESNITDENLKQQLEVSAKLANFTKEIWKETIKYPWKTFKDPDVRRQFQKFSVLGTAILSPSKYERFNKIISDMQSVYGKAKICDYHNRTDCSLQLEPELTEIFVKSRDPEELRYYWQQWRDAVGRPVRKMYKEYVDLSNEAAALNNFTNNAEFWLKDYEAKDFKEQVEKLWEQLRPLYLQLHAYVRRRLREQYGEQHVTKRGPIPAHLLGNMWAQSWGNIFDLSAPYPDKPSMDVTPNMVEQGYTPLGMFKLAEEFFTSLGLSPMPETFWRNSILEKPKDGRDLICHASAWDFYDGKDFRIKQCTRITMEDLNTVHHEMGHIQYFLQYKNQPLVYKEGTNPGFHEAVGDVMALSVSTPKHLRKIGLLNATEDDAESEINQLYNMALDKIAFLPFGYLMDQWRWSVFEGKTTERDYNCKWWQLREKYQGLSPSVMRSEDDFDPGAKYHTVGNVPYIRYFVSFVIQFQFHRSLCIAAKEFNPDDPISKPLHKCDIYQSKEAGALLKKMLQMGSSKPWPDAMEVITGQREMDARALLDYFGALQDWLEKENRRTGEFIGWEPSRTECEWDEEGEKATPSYAQGNFEDDNIGYSYAEFVRQDDNTFGFPDYLEEVQPSYHALQRPSKENEYRASYFIPKSDYGFSGKQNIYYARAQNDLFDVSELQRLKSRAHSRPEVVIPGGDAYKIWEMPKHAPSEESGAFEGKQSSQSAGDAEIISAILKDVEQLEDSPPAKEGSYKLISNRDTQEEVTDNQKFDVTTNTEANVTAETKQPPDTVDTDNTEERNDGSQEAKKSVLQETAVTSKMVTQSDDSPEEKIEDVMTATSKIGAKAECILETAKKFSSKTLDYQVPNELIWRSELVKNEAEQMLKNFNKSFNPPNPGELGKWPFRPFLHISPEETPEDDKLKTVASGAAHKLTRNILPLYNTPENFKPGKFLKLSLKSIGSSSKSSGALTKRGAQGAKHFREYDLVDVLPVEGSVNENRVKLEGKRSPVRSEFTYVLLLGKLSDNELHKFDSEKKSQKKSYKEYHYNVRTPVVYNSVTITPPGGKNDKGEELKEHSSKVSRRAASYLGSRSEGDARPSLLRPLQKIRQNVFTNKFSRFNSDPAMNSKNEFPANGGAGMNVTFVIIIMAMFLHAYTSHWFQKLDLQQCRAKWTTLRGLFANNPMGNMEATVESAILGTNWTFFKTAV